MGPASGLPVTGFPEFWTGDGTKKHLWLETRHTIPEQTDQARPIVTVLQCNPTELKTILCHYMLVGSNLHGAGGEDIQKCSGSLPACVFRARRT